MKCINFISTFFIYCVISPPACSSNKVLGIAACQVWGEFKTTCSTEDIAVTSFPPECTSILYDVLDLTDSTVVDLKEPQAPVGYLDSLAATKKPVFVSYSRVGWAKAVQDIKQNGAAKEIESWKTYLNKHKVIAGLAISGLELNKGETPDSFYTGNLLGYLAIMKKALPNTKFGIYINSEAIISILGTDQLKCLDFKALEPQVEFFVIQWTATVEASYNCTSPKFKHGDVAVNDYMLSVQKYLEGIKIPKEKLVIDIFGRIWNPNQAECDTMYTAMCLNPNNQSCAATQQNYYDKATYYKQHVSGFALQYIDKDDAKGSCQCGRSFPMFYALLDGFTDKPAPKICPLFDRPDI